jgi:hypothetical protein
MMTVNLPVAPEMAYVKARQAVAAMGGHILNYDDTVRMAFAHVPGPVVLNIAVLPDRNGASVQVIGPHSTELRGRRGVSYVEGCPALDFPFIHDTWPPIYRKISSAISMG